MYGHTDLKKEVLIELEGVPYRVVESSHIAMGRGGAVMRTKLKNLLSGGVGIEKSFRSSDKIAPAEVDRQNMQLLYREGSDLVFMNQDNYEQATLAGSVIGDQAKYLAEGAVVQLLVFQGKIIGADMPNNVFLKVTSTEPGVKGDTANQALKPAELESGVQAMVPYSSSTRAIRSRLIRERAATLSA